MINSNLPQAKETLFGGVSLPAANQNCIVHIYAI